MALLYIVTFLYIWTAVVFWTIQELGRPTEYMWFVKVSLIVHAAHGLFWDAILWGYYYFIHPQDNGYTKLGQVVVDM